jgi:hypothetical protein
MKKERSYGKYPPGEETVPWRTPTSCHYPLAGSLKTLRSTKSTLRE